MSSSSSGSSSESSSSPARKKRQFEVESSDSDGPGDHHDTSDANSASEQPLPSTEATVLSHAERRRQKKKQARQLALATTPQSESPWKKRKLDDGTASNININASANVQKMTTTKTKTKAVAVADDPRWQKRQNSVWVGNLAFRTTEDALRGFFDGVGTITRVHMPMRRGKPGQSENMGFAYVDFETSDAKTIAITLSEGQLDGRNLLIKDGDDFTGRPAKAKTEPTKGADGSEEAAKGGTTAQGKTLSKALQKILRAQKQSPAPTLFLGNLGFETTEESIRELFEAHRHWDHKDKGKGVDVKVEDEDKGKSEGQGGEAKSKDVWIRKIRMGTFEDSGTCKGFAFVDFTSIEHATQALINPRNHRLNGRDLVVEYASPDAVRRGGGPRHPKGDRDQKSGSGNAQQKASASMPYQKQRWPRHAKQDEGAEAAVEASETTTSLPRRPDRAGHDRQHMRRAKPGAALALAQRQSAAILPSQGQKIVF